MRPLTGLDASFLYLESNRTPMHIGGIYILDRARSDPSFGYDRFVSHIESRLRRSMIFRERLAEVPMNLSHPYWINDPEFELEFHLPRTALPSPGGRTQLMQLAARQFALPLNRERPLWQMMFVEGLNDFPGVSEGSFAIIARVHHAVVGWHVRCRTHERHTRSGHASGTGRESRMNGPPIICPARQK